MYGAMYGALTDEPRKSNNGFECTRRYLSVTCLKKNPLLIGFIVSLMMVTLAGSACASAPILYDVHCPSTADCNVEGVRSVTRYQGPCPIASFEDMPWCSRLNCSETEKDKGMCAVLEVNCYSSEIMGVGCVPMRSKPQLWCSARLGMLLMFSLGLLVVWSIAFLSMIECFYQNS